MKKIFVLCALCTIAGNTTAFAIEDEGTPDSTPSAQPTQLTQSRLSGKLSRKEIFSLSNKIERRKNATVKVEVVTSQDIENQNSPAMSSLMNQITGVTVQQSGSTGDISSFRIRGSDRVKVLIDGVRADDSNENKFYLQDYLSDDFERIEVVKGPAGDIGGAQASGGLVGLFTRRGYGRPTLKLQSDFGGYGTFRERASFGGSNEKTDYYLSTTFLKTDGGARFTNQSGNIERIKNDFYRNFSVVGNFGHKFLDGKAEVRNITRLSNARKGIGTAYAMDAFWNFYPVQDPKNYSKNLNFTNTSIFNYAPNEVYDSSTRFGIYTNAHDYLQFEQDPSIGLMDNSTGNSFYRASRLNFVSQHNFNYKDINRLSIGYNMEYEWYNANSWYGDDPLNWAPAHGDSYKGNSVQNDVYVNDTVNIKDILFLRGGARFSHHSLFGSSISPNGSAALVLPTFKLKGAHSKLRGSWGRSVNNPSFYQRFGQVSSWGHIANPNLKREQFEGWDVGFEQAFFNEKLTFDFGYFNNKYKDYINWAYDMSTFSSMYVNVDRARIKGWEASVSWQPNEKFRTSLGYTHTYGEDTKTGLELSSIPRNRVNAAVYYTPSDRFTLYTSVAGATDRVSYGGRAGGFVDVSLGTKVKLYENERSKVYLTAQIFNLLNQKISMIKGMYHPGISCLVGLNVEFRTKGKWL